MIKARNQLLADGKTVPMTKLCAWLGLPRSSAYYQPKTSRNHRPVDEELVSKIKTLIEKEPTCGVLGVWTPSSFP